MLNTNNKPTKFKSPLGVHLSFLCCSQKYPEYQKVGYFSLDKKTYSLSKIGNTWNLTASTSDIEIYGLSKDKDMKFYLRIKLSYSRSGVNSRLGINSKSNYSINKILKKEEFNLMLEFKQVCNGEFYCQPMILNLDFKPNRSSLLKNDYISSHNYHYAKKFFTDHGYL